MNKKKLIPEVVDESNYGIGLFLFIHNLFVWVYFHSSTTSGMGLFLFIHNLWNRSLFIHPEPLVWSLFIHPQPLV
jgi:hypothetical protein